METKFAPVYTTMVISYLEELQYDEIKGQFGNEYTTEFKLYCKR